jgi:Mg-chelatase subunit ChlD
LSNVKDKDILAYEIVKGRSKPKYYEQLAKNLGFKDIKELTQKAVQQDNVEALMAMAQANIYAVTAELAKAEYSAYFAQKMKDQKAETFVPQLFFMVRSHAPIRFRLLLQRITRSIILKTSLNISGRGYRGKYRHRVRYHPGLSEFDLEQTFHNYLQGGQILTMHNIVGLERRQIKKNVVLILDTSGSMYGQLLLNAALTTSVLSYAMSRDYVSVVLYSSEAYVLKGITETRKITKLIDQILESEAVGFTNITKGLQKGLSELRHAPIKNNKQSFGILITDGEYNRGQDPSIIAKEFPRLHVIGMPSDSSKAHSGKGEPVCQRIAQAGRGHYIPVKEISAIPRALMNLLARL